jgi:general secretion pathway protein B
MSYILEALKKLEEKRAQEEPPGLSMFSRGHRPERKKRLSWPYLLAGALLLNAVAMIWVSERQGGKGEIVAEKAAVPRESLRSPSLPAPQKRHNPAAEGPRKKREARAAAQGLTPLAPAASGTAAPDVPQMRAAKDAETEKPQAQFESAETQIPQAQFERSEDSGKRTAGKVTLVNELPAAVRSGLPAFRISGHAYSPEPRTRVTRINEKILQEGQELAPGLKLEEIVPDGVIFSYRGYRFRVGLNGNR